jgi:crotonobetainyl-CoA:carnitine CoA-transferase CaiB-like acyl-CoA transferase
VNGIDDVFADPQLRQRGMVIEDGAGRTIGNPIKLSDTPPSIRTPPPTFGQDTDGVLRELGFAEKEIARLRTDGVV